MSYTLFLDDEREPQWWLTPEVFTARTELEFELAVLMYGVPHTISFDHDLGGSETGLRCLNKLIELHLNEAINLGVVEQVIVHSHNPVGAQNIAGLWDSFAAAVLESEVKAEVKPWQKRPSF